MRPLCLPKQAYSSEEAVVVIVVQVVVVVVVGVVVVLYKRIINVSLHDSKIESYYSHCWTLYKIYYT